MGRVRQHRPGRGTQFAKEAFQIAAPVAGQVYAARTNAHTQEVVARYNAHTQIAMVQGFQNLGDSGHCRAPRQPQAWASTAVTNVAAQIPQPGAVTTYALSATACCRAGPAT
jgi:hypothetical protein